MMKDTQVEELLYQALETELGGVQVYKTAIRCTVNEDLREEWQGYLDETENHVRIVGRIFEEIGLDPEIETPGRAVVRFKGQSLIQAMEMALEKGDRVRSGCRNQGPCQLGAHRGGSQRAQGPAGQSLERGLRRG
jgi:rubrerythrin